MPAKRPVPRKHVVHHRDGTIWARGQMVDDDPTGYWEWFRKDGTRMRSGYFEQGEQVGEWTTYDQQGRVYKVTTMKAAKGERTAKAAKAAKPAKGAKARPAARAKPSVGIVDGYLAALPDDQRAALEKVRKAIRAAAPRAEECISYQLPAYRLDGKLLVSFGASAKHCAFYPMSGSTIKAHEEELADYDTSKGTIRFPATKPLPAALVKKLVKARIAENATE